MLVVSVKEKRQWDKGMGPKQQPQVKLGAGAEMG